MNKYIFCCSTMRGSYCFSASWDEKLIVNYEIEDHLFEKYNDDLKIIKNTLDIETSRKFVEYIEKASISTIEKNIEINKENPDFKGFCTDAPTFQVMYMNGCWFDTANWDSGEFGSTIEQQKYLYFAMMLCDKNIFKFVDWAYEEEKMNIAFSGRVRDFYFFTDNNEINFEKYKELF